MPIRPIDLQTMLMQLGQVQREQSAEKEGAALASAMKNASDLKRLEETKESVHRTEEPEAGAKAVGEGSGRGGEGAPREGAEEGKGEKPAGGAEVITDPDLGTRVDLSG